MPKRDWQKDSEVANSLPATVGLVYYVTHTQDLLVVAGVNAKSLEERGLVIDWFNEAREGWPAALGRVMELEEVLNKCLQCLRDECHEGCSDNPEECWVENCPVKKAVDLILGALNKEVENNA
jgi:hypothetical protein